MELRQSINMTTEKTQTRQEVWREKLSKEIDKVLEEHDIKAGSRFTVGSMMDDLCGVVIGDIVEQSELPFELYWQEDSEGNSWAENSFYVFNLGRVVFHSDSLNYEYDKEELIRDLIDMAEQSIERMQRLVKAGIMEEKTLSVYLTI